MNPEYTVKCTLNVKAHYRKIWDSKLQKCEIKCIHVELVPTAINQIQWCKYTLDTITSGIAAARAHHTEHISPEIKDLKQFPLSGHNAKCWVLTNEMQKSLSLRDPKNIFIPCEPACPLRSPSETSLPLEVRQAEIWNRVFSVAAPQLPNVLHIHLAPFILFFRWPRKTAEFSQCFRKLRWEPFCCFTAALMYVILLGGNWLHYEILLWDSFHCF